LSVFKNQVDTKQKVKEDPALDISEEDPKSRCGNMSGGYISAAI